MKKLSLYTPVFSTTLLLSAALLFSVQPMFSKMILPLLGGTPQVWNTAMLFFQVMLLAGYAYAHATSRYLNVRAQALLHIALLVLFFFVLPFGIPAGWEPPANRDPRLWQLSLMMLTIGGPFFVLSGSAPMLQHWFSATDHPDAGNPYFLYGASNIGSMAALLSYPFVVEPLMDLPAQAQAWRSGYALLVGLTVLAALLAAFRPSARRAQNKNLAKSSGITGKMRLTWLALAFIPSSLMLGVTTYITTDIGSVPLLWVVPLALYVGTFIIVFARRHYLSAHRAGLFQAGLMVALILLLVSGISVNPWTSIGLHLALFFFAALSCHAQLAALKPAASGLTEFYLLLSAGGALGGFFNAILAPSFFVIPLEYGLALIAALFMRDCMTPEQSFSRALGSLRSLSKENIMKFFASTHFLDAFLFVFALFFAVFTDSIAARLVASLVLAYPLLSCMSQRWLFASLTATILLFFTPGNQWNPTLYKDIIHRDRNFFGVIKVADMNDGVRMLLHGTTNHGTQPLDPKTALEKVSYYGPDSPLSDLFHVLDRRPGRQNVAVLGLGIGVTSCYRKPGRHFDFFEIDPAIVKIAENKNLFTYLSGCGSPYDIIIGDGRLSIKKQPDRSYDLILLDAFSSDNIPVHLMTQDAMTMYADKLRPDGLLVFHVSNNFMDLEPVLAKEAQKAGLQAMGKASSSGKLPGTEIGLYPAHFVVLAKSNAPLASLKKRGWSPAHERKGIEAWTDQFSNIISVLGNETGQKRMRETYDLTNPKETKPKEKH